MGGGRPLPAERQFRTERLRVTRGRLRGGPAEDGLSADVFYAAAATADEHVNRSMAIEDVSRTARIVAGEGANATGTLRLSFTWTNFANVSNGELLVGDAFAGGWFGDLGESQTLLVYPPEGYTVQTVSPSTRFQNGALQWQGPREFETGPQITLAVGGTPLPLVPTVVAVLGALLLGGLVVYFWYGPRRESEAEGEAGAEGAAGTEPSGPPEATSTTTEAETETGTGESEKSAETGAETGTSTETEAETEGGPVDEELLSDEERVERLLEEHGGRMKQAKIVEETRWSNAKVSQLLSSMADEGRVEKLRIGRENLISLPDEGSEEEE
ncbi:helix-turn-helix transcriptional regulator [Halospeciosus flavus]|uniref:helix-turn-helix transcriptional regulator n=1 Tax=Halospeciosus flavus TaxID=3032283 RepID=UPI00360C9E36